jgi:uncharacterized protein YbcV (DUF1398 family)
MNEDQKQTAQACKDAAENNTMDFPAIVQRLMTAGFERYVVDFCAATATYYLPCGDSITLDTPRGEIPVGEAFDSARLQAAISDAQMKVAGYTYAGFREKAMAAGCACYIVSFTGRRAVYFGRTAETHVELFPQ